MYTYKYKNITTIKLQLNVEMNYKSLKYSKRKLLSKYLNANKDKIWR